MSKNLSTRFEAIKQSEEAINNTREERDKKMPVDSCSFFDFMYFNWMTKIMWNSFMRGITKKDVYSCSIADSADINGDRFINLWQEECREKGVKNASLSRVWLKFVAKRILISSIFYLLCLIFGYLSGIYFMRQLLKFIDGPENSLKRGTFWVLSLTLFEFSRLTCFSLMYAVSTRTTSRSLSALNACLYQKLFSSGEIANKRIGEISNLFSSDCVKITQLIHTIPLLVGSPLIILFTIIYTWYLFGIYTVFSISMLILSLILQVAIGKKTRQVNKMSVKATDDRVSLLNEIITNIKFVKLYAWEDGFTRKIRDLRKRELHQMRRNHYLHCCNSCLSFMTPLITTIGTILLFTLFKNNLTTIQAFTLIMVNNIAAHGIRQFPTFTRELIQANVSIKRVENFLLHSDINSYLINDKKSNNLIELNDATLCWSPNGSIVVDKMSFTVNSQTLVGIVGSVGSGKTALLNTLAGELILKSGKVCVNGNVAYVSQQPCVFNGTIRENIVFEDVFDERKYNDAINFCALSDDLAKLALGDRTIVGEKGINLSGGQKQRIALARAVYADCEIYLLDDPLSALDVRTAEFVFTQCIKTILAAKTVIMVVSHPYYMKRIEYLLFLKNYKLIAAGSFDELLQNNDFKMFWANVEMEAKSGLETSALEKQEEESINTSADCSPTEQNVNENKETKTERSDQKLIEKPIKASVSLNTYIAYCRAMGGYVILVFIMIIFILLAVSSNFNNWWLSYWLSKGNGTSNESKSKQENIIENPNLHFYQTMYAISALLMLLLSLLSGFLLISFTSRASDRLHNDLFLEIFHSRMSYFERTSIGHIWNNLVKDMSEGNFQFSELQRLTINFNDDQFTVDNHIPRTLESFLNRLLFVLANTVLVVSIYPWFVFPAVILTLIFVMIHEIFSNSMRDLKRIVAASRSPIFTHINSTLQSLTDIKIFRKQLRFTKKFHRLLNTYIAAHYMHQCSMRWMFIRLDILCISITFFVCIFAVLYKSVVGVPFAALAITLSLQLSNSMQTLIRMACDFETRFIAIERIIKCIEDVRPEKEIMDFGMEPPPQWPTEGNIKFLDVTMKYGEDFALALDHVNFQVNAKEKVGIIGKTAAGKSSIAAVLFRLVELNSGTILIDNSDISKINLRELRRRLTIIPQDPILLRGTIRYNLDPFSNYTDEYLIEVLEKVQMKNKITSFAGSLDTEICENGKNFSTGEKQLLCLGRALLRKSKIIILDEATTFVDAETENIIRNTISELFGNCTMIIIAHKLQTIRDCHRLLIVKDSQVFEFNGSNDFSREQIFSLL